MEEISLQLPDLLHSYGQDWQIQQDGEGGVWTAIRRPTPTALRILVANDLVSLAAKIAAQPGELQLFRWPYDRPEQAQPTPLLRGEVAF